MVVCNCIEEVHPDRSRDERRLIAAFRALPESVRAALLRDAELRSFNFPATPEGDSHGS